jgi:hypothetical protein
LSAEYENLAGARRTEKAVTVCSNRPADRLAGWPSGVVSCLTRTADFSNVSDNLLGPDRLSRLRDERTSGLACLGADKRRVSEN